MKEKNSIRIKKDIYEIEVNDNGDKIYFDLKDISIGNKYLEAIQKVNEEKKKYNKELQNIFQKYNLKMDKIKKINFDDGIGRDIYQLEMNFFYKAREIIDGVLGKNACQKIFGDSNYPEMFDELAKALEPHFKRMQFDIKSRQKELLKKYNNNKKEKYNKVIS